MKYDPELMLQLVRLVEAKPDNDILSVDQIQLPTISRDQLVEHFKLLIEENLLLGSVQNADNQVHEMLLTRLTLKGHQFLAVANDQTNWRKLIKLAQAGVGFITAEGLKLAIDEMIKNLLR